jgi:hypothetical protein
MIKVYLANRPPLAEYLNTEVIFHLRAGEIKRIARETGNHWRKIFNVYAKLVYCFAEISYLPLFQQYPSWQDYRDQSLLQQGSNTELHLDRSALCLESSKSVNSENTVHIIMGKLFSERLLADISVEWLDNDFAINRQHSIIVCPYFDYRQLSNIKIERLAKLVRALQTINHVEALP